MIITIIILKNETTNRNIKIKIITIIRKKCKKNPHDMTVIIYEIMITAYQVCMNYYIKKPVCQGFLANNRLRFCDNTLPAAETTLLIEH